MYIYIYIYINVRKIFKYIEIANETQCHIWQFFIVQRNLKHARKKKTTTSTRRERVRDRERKKERREMNMYRCNRTRQTKRTASYLFQ